MKSLDTTRFVVLGDGLSAGMINFSLCEDDERASFAALPARQLKADFPLPLVQGPALGAGPGFPRLPVGLPWDQQTTVLSEFPATTPISNLSVPGMTIAEAASRRPVPPAVHQNDAKQTAINFILGMPGLLK